MRNDRFAVIVPAYNEATNMKPLIAELRQLFASMPPGGEVVLVDDGSTDGTLEEAARHAAGWNQITLVRHNKNLGKTEAIVSGSEVTDAQWLVIYDADLQHDVTEIPRFVERLREGNDIVTGRKVGHYEKHVVSRIYNALGRRLFDVPVSDMNSMKAFDRDVLEGVRLRHDWHRFFVAIAHHRGHSMTEIDIELRPRRSGESKYQGAGRVFGACLDLIAVWFYLRFSRKPLAFFGVASAALGIGGVAVMAAATAMRTSGWVSPIGYRPYLLLSLGLVLVSVMLLGFGLLAEMILATRNENSHGRARRVLRVVADREGA